MTVKQELARKAGNIREKENAETASEKKKEGAENLDGKPLLRLLRADEIECRVGTVNEKGLSILLFKDARVDQKILDETFTPFGWRRTHQSIEGNLYCTVEIWDQEKEQWIAKQDVGTTSYSEKEKGQASDSFKRACFNWGLGRELYTAPFIWIPAGTVSIQQKGDRYVTQDRFSVHFITYNTEREISALAIINGRGAKVFEWRKKEKAGDILEIQKAALEKELERTGVTMEDVLGRYQLKSIEEMTPELYDKALQGLKKSKTKKAA